MATMCRRRIINEGDRPLSDLLCHKTKGKIWKNDAAGEGSGF